MFVLSLHISIPQRTSGGWPHFLPWHVLIKRLQVGHDQGRENGKHGVVANHGLWVECMIWVSRPLDLWRTPNTSKHLGKGQEIVEYRQKLKDVSRKGRKQKPHGRGKR